MEANIRLNGKALQMKLVGIAEVCTITTKSEEHRQKIVYRCAIALVCEQVLGGRVSVYMCVTE